ncbi:MAG: hypothetical protein J3K34DRAFT_406550 [Monoraphidium minutum]|nr:MAG: hypothetical protein J3K34DRAFT_406550 [Monoraphidium minutum]
MRPPRLHGAGDRCHRHSTRLSPSSGATCNSASARMLASRPTLAAAGASRARTVSVVAQQRVSFSQAAAAGLVSFALAASPALAGVVLEQPALKKVFQAGDDVVAAAPGGAAAPAKAAKAAPKKEVAETSSGGISPQVVALPAALVFVGGGAFALTSVDPGFTEFMRTASAKDSVADGAGYEPAIKGEAGAPKNKSKKGTK